MTLKSKLLSAAKKASTDYLSRSPAGNQGTAKVAACIHHSEIALDEVGHVVKLGGDSSAAAAIVGLGQIAAALLNLGARSHFQGETQEQRDAFAASLARVYAMPTAAPQVFSRNPAAVS